MANEESSHVAAKRAVIKLCQNDNDLMNLVGGRVFPQSLAEFVSEEDQEPAGLAYPRIHFRVVGGSADQSVGKFFPTNLIVQCWSKDGYTEAWKVARNFRRVINLQTSQETEAAVNFHCTNPGQEVFDPTAQLYYIVQQYRLNIIEKT